jgi:hypothetical protein
VERQRNLMEFSWGRAVCTEILFTISARLRCAHRVVARRAIQRKLSEMKEAIDLLDSIPSFAFTWTTFFGAGIVLFLLKYRERIVSFSILDAFRTCIPFDPIRSQSFHTDLKIYLIRKLTDFIFLVPGAYVLFLVSDGIYDGLSLLGTTPYSSGTSTALVLGVACILIIAAEFNAFLWHYLEHKVPFLWELHKVHHSADNLNPLTNKRSHSFMQGWKICDERIHQRRAYRSFYVLLRIWLFRVIGDFSDCQQDIDCCDTRRAATLPCAFTIWSVGRGNSQPLYAPDPSQ